MSKIFKDLKDGDTVYVVEGFADGIIDTIIECKIHIKFEDFTIPNDIYIHKKYSGYLDSGITKFKSHSYSGQYFRISTVYRKDNKPIPQKEFNEISETGAMQLDEYTKNVESSHCVYANYYHIFTDLKEAKDFIVDYKLKEIKKNLLKAIKVKKYKEKSMEQLVF